MGLQVDFIARTRRYRILPVGRIDGRRTQTSYSLVAQTQTRPRLPRVIGESRICTDIPGYFFILLLLLLALQLHKLPVQGRPAVYFIF